MLFGQDREDAWHAIVSPLVAGVAARTEQPPLAAVDAGSHAEFLIERQRLMAAVIRDSYQAP